MRVPIQIAALYKNVRRVHSARLEALAGMTIPLPFRSVYRPGRCVVRELHDSVGNPAPGRRAVVIAVDLELVGARGALFEGLLAVAAEHQVRGGITQGKLQARRLKTFNTKNCIAFKQTCQGGGKWRLVLRIRHMIHLHTAQPCSSLRSRSNEVNHLIGSEHRRRTVRAMLKNRVDCPVANLPKEA